MHFNPATVLFAISSLTATYAIPVANQQNGDESLERRELPYSVVAVDGSSQSTSAPVEVKTVDSTKYIAVPAASTSITTPVVPPTPIPAVPGGSWNGSQARISSPRAAPVRKLSRSLKYVNSTENSLESRSQNGTYGASTPGQVLRRSEWINDAPVNLTNSIGARGLNSTYHQLRVSVPKLPRAEGANEVTANSTANTLEIRSSNSTSLKARNLQQPETPANSTSGNKFGIRSSNVTFHMPIPVHAPSKTSNMPLSTSAANSLPPLPPQPSQAVPSDTVPAVELPQYYGDSE